AGIAFGFVGFALFLPDEFARFDNLAVAPENRNGAEKIQTFGFPQPVDRVSARVAAETLISIARRILHLEGRRALFVECTAAPECLAAFAELDPPRDQPHQVDVMENVVNRDRAIT